MCILMLLGRGDGLDKKRPSELLWGSPLKVEEKSSENCLEKFNLN
jgi:hypothetical protein